MLTLVHSERARATVSRFTLVFRCVFEDGADIDPSDCGGVIVRIGKGFQSVLVRTDRSSKVAEKLQERISGNGVHTHIELSERAGCRMALYSDRLAISMNDRVSHALAIESALRSPDYDLVIHGTLDDTAVTDLRDGVLGTVEAVEVEKRYADDDELWIA